MIRGFRWDKNKYKWSQIAVPQDFTFNGEFILKEGEDVIAYLDVLENETEKVLYIEETESLLSIRPRHNAIMGIQTITADTRLGDTDIDEKVRNDNPQTPVTDDIQASWDNEDSIFKLEENI